MLGERSNATTLCSRIDRPPSFSSCFGREPPNLLPEPAASTTATVRMSGHYTDRLRAVGNAAEYAT